MNRLWYTDGLSRKQYEERKRLEDGFCVLEERGPELMERVVEMMHKVLYFNSENQADGVLYELFRFQPLLVLAEIRALDTEVWVRKFRLCNRYGKEGLAGLVKELACKLEEWDRRLAYYRELQLTLDLHGQGVMFGMQDDPVKIKREYFTLIETIRKLQRNYSVYLDEICENGKNDPALGILEVFLENYGAIAARFNKRWEGIFSFYFEEILEAGMGKALPDRTWLTLQKSAGGGEVVIPKDTAFVAGKKSDGSPFFYRSVEDIQVTDLKFAEVGSYFLQKDTGRFPAARLGYVTAVLKNELEVGGTNAPRTIFGGPGSRDVPIGLWIESPMFLLREGCRTVKLIFRMTKKSQDFFDGLVRKIGSVEEMTSAEIIYKMLGDAFFLEISTENGWLVIPEYMLTREGQDTLQLVFRLSDGMQPTAGCRRDIHGRDTRMPALKIVMNRNAWLFPYSWARQIWFDKLLIRTEVTGISRIKLYNAGGEQDASVPVYPLGVQPDKGAWLVFGYYEMALKPLKEVVLTCRWQQLPDHPEGLYGYYRGYGAGIDNYSFRVRTEWLVAKRWQATVGSKQYLFHPGSGGQLIPQGPLPEESCIVCRMPESTPGVRVGETEYVYGRTESGFFRVVLDAPEMGFGHVAYRQIFADVMIENSRRKRPLVPPALPLSPLAESFGLAYVAEEEICFAPGQKGGDTHLYHICPLTSAESVDIAADQPVALADGPEQTGNLLLGFRQAEGVGRIRFFVDIAPLQQEIDLRDRADHGGIEEPLWYMNDGRKWVALEVGALLKDTTLFFMNSGIVEIRLPEPVCKEQLDENGIFWLCAAFREEAVCRPEVRGFYVNAVEVVSEMDEDAPAVDWVSGLPVGTIVGAEQDIPGLSCVYQIVAGQGGRLAGGRAEARLRLPDRIAHRNRAVLPADYERLVLQHFPQVAKVKCLPGVDTKGKNRRSIVTLVIVPQETGNKRPLATHQLLLEIEQFLEKRCGAGILVDAVNPVYEEIIVRCQVIPEQGTTSGEVVDRLRKRLNECIAPWENTDGIPEFNYRFSLKSLQNVILEESGVAALRGLTVLHITVAGQERCRLNEYSIGETEEQIIGASCSWGVAVPAVRHLIEVKSGKEWEERTGIGKLEIGHTLVVRDEEQTDTGKE